MQSPDSSLSPAYDAPRHDRYASLPLAYIELHSHCNRDCPFCPRFHDRSGRRKDVHGEPVIARMPTDKVYLLLDQLAAGGYRGEIGLFHNSDPFLDKRYLQFARYAVARGMRLRENTNGDVLRSNLVLCEQLDGLISILTIGLYDYSTHSEKLKEMEFWRSIFKKTEIRFSTPYENLNPRQFAETYTWLFKDERMLDVPCQYRRDYLFVAYDGTAVLCCQDDYGAFGLGNIFEDGIDHVLFSTKRKMINDILDRPSGRRKFDLCSKMNRSISIFIK